MASFRGAAPWALPIFTLGVLACVLNLTHPTPRVHNDRTHTESLWAHSVTLEIPLGSERESKEGGLTGGSDKEELTKMGWALKNKLEFIRKTRKRHKRTGSLWQRLYLKRP